VYTIGVLNFSLSGGHPGRYVREVQLMDIRTFEVFYEKLTFIYLELPKFRKTDEQLVTHFDKWLYVLNNLPALQEIPATLRGGIFVKVFDQAEIAKLSPEDMRTYEQSLKVYRDNQNTMNYAIQTAVEKAVKEAVAITQKEEAIKVAKDMKQDNLPLELIMKYSKLTREEIEKL
jgi:predicted transposase/invertase (TIGR01784 family)